MRSGRKQRLAISAEIAFLNLQNLKWLLRMELRRGFAKLQRNILAG